MPSLEKTLDLLEEVMDDRDMIAGETGRDILQQLQETPPAHDLQLFALIKKVDKDRALSKELNRTGIRQALYAKMAFSPQMHASLNRLCAAFSQKLQAHRPNWAGMNEQERVKVLNDCVIDTLQTGIDAHCLDENLLEERAFVVLEEEEAYPGYEGFADPDNGQIHLLRPENDPELADFDNTHDLTLHEFAHAANAVFGQKKRLYGWVDENEMTDLDYKMNEYFWQDNRDTDEMHQGAYINPVEAIAREKEASFSLVHAAADGVSLRREGLRNG